MKLYFLRHGRADRSAWSGSNDDLRPLTEEGKDRMHRQAQAMAALKLPLDAILSSPLVRARQTAEITANHLHMEDILHIDEKLAPGFFSQDLKDIASEYSSARALMLVGHEPDFSELISLVIGGGDVKVKKGSLIHVDMEDPRGLSGTLMYSLPAKVLLRMKH